MGSELKGLFRKLEWSDFSENAVVPAPKPGGSATAAKTEVDYSFTGVNVMPVAGGKPVKYRLTDTVVINIRLKPYPASWKAKWLGTLSQTQQDELLRHERGHYRLAALMIRDLFVEIMHLKGKDYASGAAALKDFKTIQDRYSAAVLKEVHDTYDSPSQTDHNPHKNAATQAAQKKWESYFDKAVSDKAPLFHVLTNAGYKFTKTRPASPVVVPIPFK